MRPKELHLTGLDLDGNEISVEADEFEARVYQHELDHLDGVLLLERLDPDTRRAAFKELRERASSPPTQFQSRTRDAADDDAAAHHAAGDDSADSNGEGHRL